MWGFRSISRWREAERGERGTEGGCQPKEGAASCAAGPRSVQWNCGQGADTPLGPVPTEDRTGAEATGPLPGRWPSGTTYKRPPCRTTPVRPPAVSDSLPGAETGGYCWDIMASAQSKKATVMSCRQSQVQRAASLSCVFTQSQVTSPLGGEQDIVGVRTHVQPGLQPSSRSGQGQARGRVAQEPPR